MPNSKQLLGRLRHQQRQVVEGFLWTLFAIVALSVVINAVLLGSEFVEPVVIGTNVGLLLIVAGTIALNNSGRMRLAVSVAGGLVLLTATLPPLVNGLNESGIALMLFFIPVILSGLLLDRLALGLTTGWSLAVALASPLIHGSPLGIGTSGPTEPAWLNALQFGLVLVVVAFLLDRFGLRFQAAMRSAVIEQSMAETRLLEEKGFSDAIIESLPGIFFLRDSSGRFVRWNGHFRRLTGYTDDELRSLDPLGLYDDEQKQVASSYIRKVFDTGSGAADLRITARSGLQHPYFISATRVELEGQTYLVASGVDRSDIDRAQAHIDTLNQALQERVERLTALREIDRAIIGSLDIDLTLGVMLDQVTTKLRVVAARILLFDGTEQVLRFGASKGLLSAGMRGLRARLGEGPSGTVARDRETLVIEGADEVWRSFQSLQRSGQEGFVAYVGVPLVAKGHLQGVLEVFDDDPLPDSDDWHDFLDALAVQAAIALSNARLFDELERSNIELRLAYDTTIEGWSRALDLKDEETEGHSRRVTELAVQLAARLGLKGEELVHVRRGALLHDIGKMGVPDRILLKPGKLDDEEWEVMKRHTTLAHELLSGIRFLRPALAIPHSHHERWDGTGYPLGLRGTDIPIAARLFAVVDVYDALTSDRPYRQAWTQDRAVGYLQQESGSHFDPEVVSEFLDMLDERGSGLAGGGTRPRHENAARARDEDAARARPGDASRDPFKTSS